jgi:hypothetical protein
VLPIEAVATLNDPRICTLDVIGVAKDGQRFLIPVTEQQQPSGPITVIVNSVVVPSGDANRRFTERAQAGDLDQS